MKSPEANRRAVAAYRERKKNVGLEEVRGIFAPTLIHAAIKEYAAALMADSNQPKENANDQ